MQALQGAAIICQTNGSLLRLSFFMGTKWTLFVVWLVVSLVVVFLSVLASGAFSCFSPPFWCESCFAQFVRAAAGRCSTYSTRFVKSPLAQPNGSSGHLLIASEICGMDQLADCMVNHRQQVVMLSAHTSALVQLPLLRLGLGLYQDCIRGAIKEPSCSQFI
jgi:hypothetical protein